MSRKLFCIIASIALTQVALAHDDDARAHYLANEGVMLEHDGRKVVFDPLFAESFGQYQLLPEDLRTSLLSGTPPWDGIDAVFISHYHDDHFDPDDMLTLMQQQNNIELFAPMQAAEALKALTDDADVLRRITSVGLDYGDTPQRFERPGLIIEAVRIPHSGWPTRRLDVENIAWRITLDNEVTVLHLGDADTRDVHFAQDSAYWEERRLDLALPPYWFFLSGNGRAVLQDRLRPEQAIGIHVPTSVPANAAEREQGLRDVDLFTRPGETRPIPPRR